MQRLKPSLYADIIAVKRDQAQDFSAIEHVPVVVKGGIIYKQP